MICLKDLIKGHRIYYAPAKQPSLFNLDQAESAKLFHNANIIDVQGRKKISIDIFCKCLSNIYWVLKTKVAKLLT